jgi:hypothetical protein
MTTRISRQLALPCAGSNVNENQLEHAMDSFPQSAYLHRRYHHTRVFCEFVYTAFPSINPLAWSDTGRALRYRNGEGKRLEVEMERIARFLRTEDRKVNAHVSSIDALTALNAIRPMAHPEGDASFQREINYRARRVLQHAARHIVGGYSNDSPEERAVDMLLRIAQEIPL